MLETTNVTTHVGLTLVKPVTTLEDLATQIRESYGQAMAAMRTSVTEARSCGKLLLQAKAQVPHGEWIGWVHTNTGISARTAQKWMRIAEFNVLGPADEYGIAKALDMIATPKVATPGTLLAKAPRKTHLDALPVPAQVIDPADLTPRQRSVARKQREGISRAVWSLDNVRIFTRHQAPTVDVGRLIAVTDRETRQQWVKDARNSRAELTRMIQRLEEYAFYDDALTDGERETLADHRLETDVTDRAARVERRGANAARAANNRAGGSASGSTTQETTRADVSRSTSAPTTHPPKARYKV